MGFHCGNTASEKLSFCEMKYQKIMARSLPIEVTQGTLEGDIKPGDITFFRLQSTADCKLRAYIAQGEVLPVATRSFGAIGIFAIPEMGRFYRHVLIEKNFPHHGAVAFGNFGKTLYEVFKYVGVPVEEIGYNQQLESDIQQKILGDKIGGLYVIHWCRPWNIRSEITVNG